GAATAPGPVRRLRNPGRRSRERRSLRVARLTTAQRHGCLADHLPVVAVPRLRDLPGAGRPGASAGRAGAQADRLAAPRRAAEVDDGGGGRAALVSPGADSRAGDPT